MSKPLLAATVVLANGQPSSNRKRGGRITKLARY